MADIFGKDDPKDPDNLKGTEDADRIWSFSGNDRINGNGGRDTIDAGLGNDAVNGGSGNDSIDAGLGNDAVNGGSGNDFLYGGENLFNTGGDEFPISNDTLRGGAGNDELRDDLGNDTHYGDEGDDNLYDYFGNDTYDGGSGNDILQDEDGNDTYKGGTGDDRFIIFSYDNQGINTVDGGEGYDELSAISDLPSVIIGASSIKLGDQLTISYSAIESIRFNSTEGSAPSIVDASGYSGSIIVFSEEDNIDDGTNNRTITGGGGDDVLIGGSGNDTITGGATASGIEVPANYKNVVDFDWLTGTRITSNNANKYLPFINEHAATFGVESTRSLQAFLAQTAHESGRYAGDLEEDWGPTADQKKYDILGNSLGNIVDSDEAPDFRHGDGWNFRGRGLIQITGRGNYTRANEYLPKAGITGVNIVDNPGLVASNEEIAVVASLWFWRYGNGNLNPYAEANNFREVTRRINPGYNGYEDRLNLYSAIKNETLLYNAYEKNTGKGNDVLSGEGGSDSISGGSGSDDLFGGDGIDNLDGGDSNDYIDGGAENDSLTGGSGNDLMFGQDGADTIRAGDGDDDLVGGKQNDNLNGEDGKDFLYGQADDDSLMGGIGDDSLYGGTENDRLTAGDGNDALYGEAGADTMLGEAGRDTLTGGARNDTLTGGADVDRFILGTRNAAGVDSITDFVHNVDKIVLSKSAFELESARGNGFSVANDFATVNNDNLAAASAAEVIYSTGSGNLFFNQNGTAAGLGVNGGIFAELIDNPTLTATDFVIA